MKYLTLFLLVLNIFLINCQNLRNLKLTMSPEKLEALTEVGTKTFKQIFQKDIDLKGTTYGILEDDKMKLEITLFDEQTIPTEEEYFRFEIVNWKATIPDIQMSKTKINLFGKTYDFKEQLIKFANSVATGYQNGYAYIYKKSGEGIVANSRYKCFVNSENGESIGSFEISQEDKNDSTTLIQKLSTFFNELGPITTGVKSICECIASIIGILKDLKSLNSSSSLKVSYLVLLLTLALF